MLYWIQHLRGIFTISTRSLLVLVLLLIGAHTAIIHIAENLGWFDSLWLTMTTIATVGYGDLSAKTVVGRCATMLLMYIGGVFVLAKVMGNLFDELADRQELKRKGLWKLTMTNHILIVGHPDQNPINHLRQLIDQIKQDHTYANSPITVVSDSIEDISELDDLRNKVHFIRSDMNSLTGLNRADVMHAQAIFFIAPSSTDPHFDSKAIDIISLLREQHCNAYIITECVKPTNHSRLKQFGANAVLHVLHGYPSIISRALTVKDSYKILHNIFSDKDEELIRMELTTPVRKTWKQIVIQCLDMEYGTPVAAITTNGQLLVSPKKNEELEIATIFVIDSGQHRNTIQITLTP